MRIVTTLLLAATLAGEYKMVDEVDFSSLTLASDGTFVYKNRGSSCFMWGEYFGRWSQHDDLLELVSEVDVVESRSEVLTQRVVKESATVTARVLDPDYRPIEGIQVYFNDSTSPRTTDVNGLASIEVADLRKTDPADHRGELSIERIELVRSRKSTSLSVSEPRANWFEVVLDLDPSRHTETRTDTYVIRGDDLVLLDPEDTSSPRRVLARASPE